MTLVTRRTVLGASGAFVATAGVAQVLKPAPRVKLRLLETSDLHMFLMDWDYYRARPDPSVGFVKIASLVRAARAEAANCLLFDNGDFLQGSPFGDFVARPGGLPEGALHPLFAAMNRLGYDAATLGNHEFNFGLDFLKRSLADAAFPFVCANVANADGSPYASVSRVLNRPVVDDRGNSWTLRVGVTGFTPPQIMVWDRGHLEGRLACEGIVESAKRVLPELRATSDIVIALSHSGLGPLQERDDGENASLRLAALGGFDVVFTGHSHRLFPGPDFEPREGVDPVRGTLAGKPAVMPGFWGSHLGLVDLTLARVGDRWIVENFNVEARPIARDDKGRVTPLVTPDAEIAGTIEARHRAALVWVEEPIGAFADPVHSYFVWAGHDPASGLVHAAQTDFARSMLAGGPHDGLPVLSAAAPFKVGFTPDAYIDIASGPVALRHVADLYVYPNVIAAVRVKGALVKEWLEHGARVFNRLDPAVREAQSLLDQRVPAYNFDAIAGLTYAIDLSRSARTNAQGRIVAPASRRIVDVRHDGKPLDDDRDYIVVTNGYRADGGGKFPGLAGSNVVLRGPDLNRDVLIEYVRRRGKVSAPPDCPWRYAALGDRRTVFFDSSARAVEHAVTLPDVRPIGPGREGFWRFQFALG